MSTWAEVVAIVLRDSGVAATGQTPSAQMQNDSKMRLTMMINQWKRRRWLVYHLTDISTPCTGAQFYTLGAGQTFNVARTDQLQAAYARQVNPAAQPNQPDFPLPPIHSYEEYSQITLKGLQAGPAWGVFYDSGYPVAKVYPYPLMNSQYELHLIIKADLDTPANLTDEIILPPEYDDAIYWNMLVRTRAAYQLPADPEMNRQAKASLNTIRMANFQVPTMNMPTSVSRGGAYNIWADSFGPVGR